ncbi:MAG: 1-acyl-sn-glycerol-3-phosphate acyltransferase [Clostridia bacterium]|nr:1-acyl-sn-glycerol-3-phosphate acyltransferase [Clostridia bacterium]
MSKPFQFHYDPDKESAAYPRIRPVIHFLVHFVFKEKVVGTENIPQEGSFIVACNHVTAIDPVFVAETCPRTLHFMAKISLFKKSFSRWLLTTMNAFPVDRSGVDMKAIRYAQALLDRGHVLGIFPEGTRSKDLKPHRAKGGVAMIAKQTHADILPVCIYFSEKPHFRSKLTIRYGEVIPYDSLELPEDEHSAQQCRVAAAFVMEKITELWQQGHA